MHLRYWRKKLHGRDRGGKRLRHDRYVEALMLVVLRDERGLRCAHRSPVHARVHLRRIHVGVELQFRVEGVGLNVSVDLFKRSER